MCKLGAIPSSNGSFYDLDEQLLKHGSPQGGHALSTRWGENLPPGWPISLGLGVARIRAPEAGY